MILIALALVCMLTVPLTGGRLTRLAELPLRWLWTAPAALILQVAITEVVPNANHKTLAAVHIVSYVLVIAFLIANRRITGMPIIAIGAISNALVIVANGGVMAASAKAQRLAGLTLDDRFHNSVVLVNPRLLFMGDIIPVPGPLPNVLSPGDCVIFLGMLVLLHAQCHWRRNTASDEGIVLAGVPATGGLVTGNLAMASLAAESAIGETPVKKGFRRKGPKTAVVTEATESIVAEAPAKQGFLKRTPKPVVVAEAAESGVAETPAKKRFLGKTPKTIVAQELQEPIAQTPRAPALVTGNAAMRSLAAESRAAEGLTAESVVADSLPAESLVAETIAPDSVAAPAPAKKGFLKKAPRTVAATEAAPTRTYEMPAHEGAEQPWPAAPTLPELPTELQPAMVSYGASYGIGGLEVSAPVVVARNIPVPEGRTRLPDVLPRNEEMLAAQRMARLTWQAGFLGAAVGLVLNRRQREPA
jgi:hypothetical protein